MKKSSQWLIYGALALLSFSAFKSADWGFFGHRRINRMAVFTLPPEMMVFFKPNIEFLTEHAVDPDKRRYATKHEAVRHYIDIDHWGTFPFADLPRNWTDALMKYTRIFLVNEQLDTLQLFDNELIKDADGNYRLQGGQIKKLTGEPVFYLPYRQYRSFYQKNVQVNYYEEEWLIDCDSLKTLLGMDKLDCVSVFANENFSEYGILPYHLHSMLSRLTRAFEEKDASKILRLSADFGHYIGDAHVPLHTTENYNGQLTDQLGIHAFWESRIPELFADKTYDYFVGKADYIDNPSEYFWDIVLTSHSYVDSVLTIEKELSINYPQDKQYCYDERLQRTVRTQCQEYAAAYQERMNGMVERRFRESIYAIGCAWFTAWVDAGQPDLSVFDPKKSEELAKQEREELDKAVRTGETKGREHGQ